MANLLTSQITLQAISSDQSVQTIFKAPTAAVQTDSTLTFSVRTLAGVPTVVPLPPVTKIQSIAAKSVLPFDLSMVDVLGQPQYTRCPSTVFVFINPVGFSFTSLTLLSLVTTEVEVSIGAKY
jgi:hypothetical protein